MKKIFTYILITIGTGIILSIPLPMFAAGDTNAAPKLNLQVPIGKISQVGAGEIGKYINALYVFITAMVISIAIITIMWAGITWITAGGSGDKVNKAKQDIITTLIGLAIALFAYYFLSIVNPDLTKLSLNSLEPIKAQECCLASEGGTPVYTFAEKSSPLCKSVVDSTNCTEGGATVKPCSATATRDGQAGIPLAYSCICGSDITTAGQFCCLDAGGKAIIQTTACTIPTLCIGTTRSCTVYTDEGACNGDMCGFSSQYGPDRNFKITGCEWKKNKCGVQPPHSGHAGYTRENPYSSSCESTEEAFDSTSPNSCVDKGYVQYIKEYCAIVGNKEDVIPCAGDIENDRLCDCKGGDIGDSITLPSL